MTPREHGEMVRARMGPVKNCIHRGAEIRRMQCPGCGGKITAIILACAVHGECTEFTRPLEGIKSCQGCVDRQPKK